MKNNFYNKLSIQKSSAGFTLIELLVAMALTTIVIGITGSGLVAITGKNQKAEAETIRRTELNRALDFISDDIRQSNLASNSTPLGWTDPLCYSGILYLSKPTGTPGGTQIAYYTRSKTCGGNTVFWRGPQIIYRSNTTNNAGSVLVDSIAVGGFTAPATNSQLVTLSLQGQTCLPPTTDNTCASPQTFTVSAKAFARAK
ncbi:MAG: prepilin-type N-terminal cleavage/methylation domain-containing protein [Gloeocapsa sp. UFS-A4-WI-NPMV-4B04]|jgi:prepilin-type N-terminal cleavage/methylation domain-containing protein|nr:prepilin-type N-terminal cleavage/methylation domain-containing protein [Gloeocapsa sp. UFS-A4-WI-NPMV-4B04]